MKEAEAAQSKAQSGSWRGGWDLLQRVLLYTNRRVPEGSREPWKVFSTGVPWPDPSVHQTDTIVLGLGTGMSQPLLGLTLHVICPCALFPLTAAADHGCVWDGESHPQSPERSKPVSSLDMKHTAVTASLGAQKVPCFQLSRSSETAQRIGPTPKHRSLCLLEGPCPSGGWGLDG